MDLQSIQAKLIQTVNTLNQDDVGVQVDWDGGPQLPATPPRPQASPRAGADFITAVDTLQWRAEATTGGFEPLAAGGGAASAVHPQVYLKRLGAMADKINHLSAEQARAIAEMQAIQARLVQLSSGFGSEGQPIALPVFDVSRAALATAEVDDQGNILLCYRTVAPGAPQPSTTYRRPGNAGPGRTTYGPATQPGWREVGSDLLALGREPMQLVSSAGKTAGQLMLELGRLIHPRQSGPETAGRLSSRGRDQLSLVDSVLWLGSGVIGRMALNLLLAALPALWSVAVAAITAITAYALYRATLAPKLTFGPAIRVFLLVMGLAIGGQLY